MKKEDFKFLGFPDKEIDIYLALMELGSAKPAQIAKKTEINRTTVYDLLESLLKKGLVSKYKKGSFIYYNALDPERLIPYLEREKEEQIKKIEKQQEKAESLIPQLISIQDITSEKPKVQFFEGEKGMREAYEDTLTSRETILAYANVQTMHEGLPNFFPTYYKRRAKKKIFIKAVLPKNELSVERAKHDQKEMRETRFLPDKQETFSPEINLYNNKMLVASWKEKMAVIIESKELVDLQKLIFNIVWKSLPRK